jgi:uncharacterized membrane protein YesL
MASRASAPPLYNPAMAVGKILLWALIGLYDEALLLLRANLVWFLVTAILGLPVLLTLIAAMPPGTLEPDAGGFLLPTTLAAFLLLLVPNPASLGIHRLAARMHRKEAPPWSEFWSGLREHLGLGLALYLIGMVGVAILAVNTVFYLRYQEGPLQALGVLFVYLLLFWLGVQLYLGPLATLIGERRLAALYRRAAMLALGQPIQTLGLLLAAALLMPLSVIVVPLYPCAAMAFIGLAATRALGQLKQKYDPDPDEETA